MKTPSPQKPLTGRQRVLCALNHQPADRVPVDLGGTPCSGAQVSVVAKLRRALGLDKPGDRVRVTEPYQMLGEIATDLRRVLGIDVVHLPNLTNMFGYKTADWKPWTTFDGTEVLVPGDFNTDPEPDGSILMYPEGDRRAKPSARMPKGGYYFDSIIRQNPIDDAKLNPADNLEEFQPIGEDALCHYEKVAADLYANTDLAIAAGFPGTAFGDIALVPGPWMKDPKGIRDIESTRRWATRSTSSSWTGPTWPRRTASSVRPTPTATSTSRTPRRSTTGCTPTRSGRRSSTVAADASP